MNRLMLGIIPGPNFRRQPCRPAPKYSSLSTSCLQDENCNSCNCAREFNEANRSYQRTQQRAQSSIYRGFNAATLYARFRAHITPKCKLLTSNPMRLVTAVLVLASFVGASNVLHNERTPALDRRHRTKQLNEKLNKEWKSLYDAAPRRQRKSECDAAGKCHWRGLQVSLAEGEHLTCCKNCDNVHLEGLAIDTWESKYRPTGYHVDGEAILAVPNDASAPLINPAGGAVVIAYRGGNTAISVKARHVQAAGATALIIIDEGSCGTDFSCGGWLGSKADGVYLAARDEPSAWSDIRIPVVLVTADQGQRLMRLMDTAQVNVEGHGPQLYTP